MSKLLFILIVFSLSVSEVAGRNVYVERENSDCINTYTLKLIVEASRNGASFGEYEDVRFVAQRIGSPDQCRIVMKHKIVQSRQNIITTYYQCVFDNPMDRH